MAILVSFLVGSFMGIAFLAMAIAAKERREQEGAHAGWGARDRDGELWLHEEEPVKCPESGQWISYGKCTRIYPERFKSISWTDTKAKRMKITVDWERRFGDE